MQIIEITGIVISEDSMRASILCDRAYWSVDAQAAARVVELLPGIGEQTCISKGHELFSEEIIGTETPHLLEHVSLELEMLEETLCCENGLQTVFSGYTRLKPRASDDLEGIPAQRRYAEVSISFSDDLVAMAAIKRACEIIDWAFGFGARPPLAESISQELHVLRVKP